MAGFDESLASARVFFLVLNIRGVCWSMKDEYEKTIGDFDEAFCLGSKD